MDWICPALCAWGWAMDSKSRRNSLSCDSKTLLFFWFWAIWTNSQMASMAKKIARIMTAVLMVPCGRKPADLSPVCAGSGASTVPQKRIQGRGLRKTSECGYERAAVSRPLKKRGLFFLFRLRLFLPVELERELKLPRVIGCGRLTR